MLIARKELEKLEESRLAPYAVKSSQSRGRKYSERESENRLAFQLDRDRIIHCKAFRRLEAKTQVFIAHAGDHFRNRLTHTLEVAQISRDIARNLGVNEDLAEAIALAHDLGHTPFGHAGEEALNEIMQKFGMHFEHNEQSRRIVEKLEKSYPDFDGLNLSIEVIEGLMKHETKYDRPSLPGRKATIEAQIANLADEIAYTNHDIDDGLRSKLITLDDLEKITIWQENTAQTLKRYGGELSLRVRRSRYISNLISMMIGDLLQETERCLSSRRVAFSAGFAKKIAELRKFLEQKLYFHPKVKKKHKEGQAIIKALFDVFYKSVDKLPLKYQKQISAGEKKEEVVKDYIAGMTDNFARREYKSRVTCVAREASGAYIK